jgi:hypothetical protein
MRCQRLRAAGVRPLAGDRRSGRRSAAVGARPSAPAASFTDGIAFQAQLDPVVLNLKPD